MDFFAAHTSITNISSLCPHHLSLVWAYIVLWGKVFVVAIPSPSSTNFHCTHFLPINTSTIANIPSQSNQEVFDRNLDEAELAIAGNQLVPAELAHLLEASNAETSSASRKSFYPILFTSIIGF
jgi:hypothetical protein